MVKQVIIVRSDISMGKGKIAAQSSHASIGAYKKVKGKDPEMVDKWEREGGKKVVLTAPLEEIMEFLKWATEKKIASYLVKDAGHTQVEPGTITALGLGPDTEARLEPTEKLKLL
ncbi:MAG: peptidyl-tRNA hydrolase [Candidatus Altiarchaeota archaeon]|nr:peptidyl-tRNA hydrolase [Candidatus Altiarchaeota archaeon]